MIQKDPAEAAKWLKMAAEHGSKDAEKKLMALEKIKFEQKNLSLLAWKESNDGTIRITGVKNKKIENIHIPDFVCDKQISIIVSEAFKDCEKLRCVYLPNNLYSIGNNVFYRCKNLKNIYLPNSLKFMGYGVFSWCKSIKEIHISDALQKIDDYTFAYCYRLQAIQLPNCLQSIRKGAFEKCIGLHEIHLPDSIQFIDNAAFTSCNNLKKIYLSRQNYEKFKHRFPETAEFIIHD